MNRRGGKLSPEAGALLEGEGAIPRLPAAVRRRVLVRARAALAARPAMSPVPSSAPSRARWAAAVALVGVVGAAAGAAAYGRRAQLAAMRSARDAAARCAAPPLAGRPPAPSSFAAPGTVPAPPSPFTADASEASAPVGARRPTAPTVWRQASNTTRDELRLLQEARAAVARKDYLVALALGEHARRFKGGRLAEEREALRIEALSGLGRANEARRAARAFVVQFPQSVLVPVVNAIATTPP